jgi:hypothetical protein
MSPLVRFLTPMGFIAISLSISGKARTVGRRCSAKSGVQAGVKQNNVRQRAVEQRQAYFL